MKKILLDYLLVLLGVVLLASLVQPSYAHPGRTASDGCHYCRTNCDSWGVPWDERHCHGAPAPTSASPAPSPPSGYEKFSTSVVTRVIDGDTIEVQDATNLETVKVRLIGIDTPETVDPRKPVECLGKEASEKMKSLVFDQVVVLKKDSVGDAIDTYGRLLRYVYLSDKTTSVNAEMVKQGYAYAYTKYPFDPKFMEEFKNYEKEAREKQIGLWASGACEDKQTSLVANVTDSLPSPAQDKETAESSSKNKAFTWITIGTGALMLGYLIRRRQKSKQV